jgi:hypothetical protein
MRSAMVSRSDGARSVCEQPNHLKDVVIVPVVIGRGVRRWDGLDQLEKRFHVESLTMPSGATHVTFSR